MRHGVLRHQERTGQVDADAPIPFGKRELFHRTVLRPGDAGIVDERVEAAELLHHPAHARAHRRFLGNVAADEEPAALDGRLDVGDRHPVATLGKKPRDVSADALRATRYQGGFLRVFSGHIGSEAAAERALRSSDSIRAG